MKCLTKSVEVITQQGEADEFLNNFVLANYADIDFHLDGIKVCLQKKSSNNRNPLKDSAILGIQAFHIADDNEIVEAHPIGNMNCGKKN